KASKNFQESVDELTKIPKEGRDWNISLPELNSDGTKKDLIVFWSNYVDYKLNNQTIKCSYRLIINEKEMKIHRGVVCTCISPISCHNNCYSKGKIFQGSVANFTIDKETGKNGKIEIFSDLIDLSEWLQK